MLVVGKGGILVGGVALQADTVARRAKFGAVGLMAIAAGDAGREHLALLERAIIVDLIQHLPVGMVKATAERRDNMGVGQPLAGHPILGKLATSCMAPAAGFDLSADEGRREVTLRISGLGVEAPD